MGASIGSASLILSANAQNLQAGLDGAYSKISAWKNSVTANVSKLDVGGLLGGAGLGKLGGPLAIAAGGLKLFGDAVASVKDLSKIGRQAQSLGVSSEAFMGLGLAAKKAGIELPQFGDLLGKMTAKVAGGGAETEKALESLGLSVGQIRGMNATDQFLAIADGISKTHDAGTQAAAALGLFGRAGLGILPTLQQGGDKLRAFAAEQLKLGAALNGKDMAAVQKANAAIPKIEAAFTGLWNKIVVAMAPIIETVATAVGKVFQFVSPLLDWVARAYTAYAEVAVAVLGEIIDAITEVVSAIAEWVSALFDMGGKWPTIGQVITSVLEFIGKAGAYAFDVLKAGAGLVVVGLSLLVDAFGLVVRALKNVLETASLIPGSVGEGFKAAAEQAQRFQTGIEGAAAGMRNWGANAVLSFGQSAEGVGRFFDKLRNKKKETDAELANSPIIAAMDPAKVDKVGKDLKNAAIIQGSKEDYSIRAKLFTDGKMQAQANEAKKTNFLLENIGKDLSKVRDAMNSAEPMPTV